MHGGVLLERDIKSYKEQKIVGSHGYQKPEVTWHIEDISKCMIIILRNMQRYVIFYYIPNLFV